MIITPPYLKAGDTIGIICTAGFMPFEKAAACIDILQQWGYRVQTGKTLGQQHFYFSGTDDERLRDLQEMLDNPNIKAILCARGGYGTGRIIDRVNWSAFSRHPKWIIGFSDITVLHNTLYTRLNTASLHAPMANAFNDDQWQNPYVQSLREALEGQPSHYEVPAHPLNRNGRAQGELTGGNLSLIAHQIGTVSDLNTNGKILFLEDIGEQLYNIDRMMTQLARAGKLDRLSGLIFGGFTDNRDTAPPFGETLEQILHGHVKDFDYPVCFQFPVSHEKENYALKVGLLHSLEVSHKVALYEISEV